MIGARCSCTCSSSIASAPSGSTLHICSASWISSTAEMENGRVKEEEVVEMVVEVVMDVVVLDSADMREQA